MLGLKKGAVQGKSLLQRGHRAHQLSSRRQTEPETSDARPAPPLQDVGCDLLSHLREWHLVVQTLLPAGVDVTES